MGRILLIAAAAVLAGAAAACAPAPEERTDGEAAADAGEAIRTARTGQTTALVDPHADLACAACHRGATGERGRATVPATSCAQSGCHDDGGPARVAMATVAFEHRDHAEGAGIDVTCAGCHTHDSGAEPLRATVDACALCHVGQVAGSRGEECRVCHQTPNHSSLTSQGVVVSHATLPWVEAGCVRCHYDVAEPPTTVPPSRCRQCHDDLSRLNTRAVGRDLHPIHEGLGCVACHEAGTHHVRAMSSAVELVCSDCHRQAHDLRLARGAEPGTGAGAEVCAACHDDVHRPQQALLLGLVPGAAAAPSGKFLAGITCRSCHIPTAATARDPGAPIRGQASACADCHEQEYERVLDWWIQGTRTRLARTSDYVSRGFAALGAREDSIGRKVRQARSLVELVDQAGGHHNLELADRLLRQANESVLQAYVAAGMQPPPVPDLGRVPHAGLCSYCHYRSSEPWNMEAMSDAFHRRVMGRD